MLDEPCRSPGVPGVPPLHLAIHRVEGSVQAPQNGMSIWVVVKIMVPFWVPIIIRHLLFRVPRKGP